MRRQLGITLADQVLSSASNFLVVLAVARVAGVEGFGAFSLAFLVYQLALGLLRAGAGDVLLIRSSETAGPAGVAVARRAGDPRRALSFVLACALPVAAFTALAGALAGGALRASLLALAATLVPALLQDCYRYVFFARANPRGAIAIDAVWLLAQLAGFVLAAAGALPETLAAMVLIWGAAATLACACGALLARVLPGLDGLAWLRVARRRVASLMADFMLLTGVSYLGFALIPLVASLSTVAALRGAQFLFNPLFAFLTSVRVVALPILARRLREGPLFYRAMALRMGAALSALTVAYSAVVLLLPDSVGAELLGDSWPAVRAILVPTSLAALAGAVSYPATEALRALGGARRLLATRASGATAAAAAMVGGAAVGGASGGAIGMCGARWGAALLWQVSLRAALAGGARPADAGPPGLSEDERIEEELLVLDGESLP